MTRRRYVTYFRVSTARQGRSGLGLEAQREAVVQHLHGAVPVAEFLEVESGKRADRPELAKALAACRLHRAILVIAKLDRLARNVAFVSNLMESGVEFIACDFPQANRLTVHILAAVAEHEAHMISERTKAALAAAKARGTKLGGFRGHVATDEARAKAKTRLTAKAEAFAGDVGPAISDARSSGARSLREIAAVLNAKAIPTPRQSKGGWSAAQVRRVLMRTEAVV